MLLSEDGAGISSPLPELHSTKGLAREIVKPYPAPDLLLTRAGTTVDSYSPPLTNNNHNNN